MLRKKTIVCSIPLEGNGDKYDDNLFFNIFRKKYVFFSEDDDYIIDYTNESCLLIKIS